MTNVNHTIFGKGEIVNQDANNVTINFNGNIKTMVIRFANLTNEDGSEFGVQSVAKQKPVFSKGDKKRADDKKYMAHFNTLSEVEKKAPSLFELKANIANYYEHKF